MFDKLKLKLYNYLHRWYVNNSFENQELIMQLRTIVMHHPDFNSLSYSEWSKNIKITIGYETILTSPSQERHLFVRLDDLIVFQLSSKNKIIILRNGKWRKAIEGMFITTLYELLKKQNLQNKKCNLGPFQNIEEDIIV